MDNTEPRNRLIAFYTVLAVATLAMLKPAFDAYYDQMFEAAQSDRLATYSDLTQLEEVEREWQEGLEGGRMPIDDAIEQLGQRGRMAMPQIAPRAEGEMNTDPLRGWSGFEEPVMPIPQQVVEPGEEGAEEGLDEGPVEAAPGEGTEEGLPAEAARPGAGGEAPPPVEQEAEAPSPEPANDPNEGETE